MKVLILTNQPLLSDYIALLVERFKAVSKVLDHYPSEAEFEGQDLLITDLRLTANTPIDTVIAIGSTALKGAYPGAANVLWCGEYVSTEGLLKLLAEVYEKFGPSTNNIVPMDKPKLTKRGKQLLVLLNRGLGNREISSELAISEHTVKVHLWRLFKCLGVNSRAQASHLARNAYPELF